MKSTVQWKEIFARFRCMIMKMEISISYNLILNGELNRDNLTRCYINVHKHFCHVNVQQRNSLKSDNMLPNNITSDLLMSSFTI